MHKKSFLSVLFSIFLVFSLSLANVSIAFADDSAPGETPTVEPVEDPGVPATVETPVAESMPEQEIEALPSGTEADTSSDEPSEATESTSDDGLLTQLPESTELVILDENGETLPLATQDALDVILDTDPMWCPQGTLPGGTNCSTNFATITLLLLDMRANSSNYDEHGIIYFTANAGSSFDLTDGTLKAGSYTTLRGFDLILQGGWDGDNGADAEFSGQTNFGSNTLTIGTETNPWVGSITLKDFMFSSVNSTNAVSIYTTTGNITLNNVDVSGQAGDDYTAYLDSNSGNITVENGSSFDGDNSGTRQSRGFRAETGGTISITGSSGTPITFTDSRGTSSDYNGVTLSAPTVTLNYVTANNNDLNGIQISNASLVTLNNVIASGNGTNPGNFGSGVLVNGTGSTVVNLTGGTFTSNKRYGVEVTNGAINVISWPTCSANDLGCLIDSVAPTLGLPSNITVEAASAAGSTVTYSATANDSLDGTVAVNCSPASGSVFPLGTTTVSCSAIDSHNHTTTGTFNISVVDTGRPSISPHADIYAVNNSLLGDNVSYDPPTTFDIVDGAGVATCSPASGSFFERGYTLVTCTATDSHGNSALPTTFWVTMGNVAKTTSTAPTSSSQDNAVVPVTAGESIDLGCSTTVNFGGIIVKFYNLCGYEAMVTKVDANSLPGELGAGMTFGNGIDIALRLNGQVVTELPAGSGVEVNFPIPGEPADFKAMFWNEGSGAWIDLQQVPPADSGNAFLRILSTEHTGTFVMASQ